MEKNVESNENIGPALAAGKIVLIGMGIMLVLAGYPGELDAVFS